MRHATTAILFLLLLGDSPAFAQAVPQFGTVEFEPVAAPNGGLDPTGNTTSDGPPAPGIAPAPGAGTSWQTAWGLVGLSAIPGGVRVAPNGGEYHPNFNIELNLNWWLWRGAGLYMFVDGWLWGETSEYGVTNVRDGLLATSKREFDLTGGAAWNYAGAWELRVFGYTNNNLNRGLNLVQPYGFTDGFGVENRYYLSPEYARLGATGFDVARATFVSFGYYPSKDMVGNNGLTFQPGMFLHAYLTCDLWNWPCYLYGDFQYISDQSFEPRLLLLDAGLAIRPLHRCPQFEIRLGSQSIADVQAHTDFSIGYGSLRYIY